MIVVLDIGTSNIRAALLDGTAQVLHLGRVKYSLEIASSGHAEMDMRLFDDALHAVLASVAAYARTHAITVCGISLTSQRSSVIPVDADGHALYNALMWQDTRSAGICEEFAPYREEIYRLTGVRLSPVFSAPKMVYLKRFMPDIHEKSHKLIGFAEYTIHALCGVFATDTSFASRTALFDINDLSWSDRLLDLFGLDRGKLCPVVPVGSVIASTVGWVRDLFGYPIPVLSAGGDQQCAALGNGCIHPGDIMANLGTGAYVLALTDHVKSDRRMRLSINVSAIHGMWIYEGAVLSAGRTLDWVNDTFFADPTEDHPYQRFTAASRNSPEGANGLRFDIHFAGKGTPDWDPKRRGRIDNLSFSHTKDDIARAVMEGIAYAVAECVEVIEETNASCAAVLHVSGGLSKDALQDDILSAVLHKEVVCAEGIEATILGAWISSAAMLGIHDSVGAAYAAASGSITELRYRASEDTMHTYRTILQKTNEHGDKGERDVQG